MPSDVMIENSLNSINRKYTFDDLFTLIQRLRDPQTGCPWDIKQDYRSIIPHTLEEVYEVVEAIEREDYLNLEEELGDLLLQIGLYAQFAAEEQRFTLHDVVSKLVAKLIRRHPHVFPEGTLESRIAPDGDLSADQVKHNWDAIKAAEKAAKGKKDEKGETENRDEASVLGDIPLAMPAMKRALKMQKRAAKVGFDWDTLPPLFAKLDEEIGELKELLEDGNGTLVETYSHGDVSNEVKANMAAELGDILFVCVNLARHLNIDPEAALRSTNHKFVTRFGFIEQTLKQRGQTVKEAVLEEMEELWQQSKGRELQE